jgi:hypothetical protein
MAEVWTWVSRSGQSISDAWEGLKLGSTSAGAALFTVFVKGAGFSSMRVHQCAKRGPIGIGQWGKRMEDKKTRTLVQEAVKKPFKIISIIS